MMQKEFEERTGMKVTPEEYARIEKLYMGTTMDKDAFCKEYKKIQSSKIVADLETSLRIEEGKLRSKQIELDAAKARENDTANFLIEQAQKLGIPELRKKAIELIGTKEYLKRKLATGNPLWEDDKKDLLEILENII